MTRRSLRRLADRVPRPAALATSLTHGAEFAAAVVAAGVASITPQSFDLVLSKVILRAFVRLRPGRVELIADRIDRSTRTTKTPLSPPVMETAREYWQMRVEVWLGEARGAGLRPWKPQVDVIGAEHVERALERGNGAVLWRLSFTSATVVNWGLKQAGFEVVHLSSDHHRDASRSRFAHHLAAPLYTRSEARLVARRIIRPANGNLAYLKELRAAVESNAVVTMVGDTTKARHSETHRVGNLKLDLPTGAPSLAYASGASLHTCVALREGPFRYALHLGPDIAEARVGKKPAARRAATSHFARELEHHMQTSASSSMFWGRR